MSERVVQFAKFIIKTIFRGVALRDFSENMSPEDIYVFHKRELNSGLLNNIFKEGEKYGYDKERCVAEIRLADEKIVISPSIEKVETNLNLGDLKRGTRINLYYNNPFLGDVKIVGIVSNPRTFMVLESTISGLKYRDMLSPCKSILVNGEKSYFHIKRGNKSLTSDCWVFVPGTLKYAEVHSPSLVFNLLDSDKSFQFKNPTSERDPEETKATKKIKPRSSGFRYSAGEIYYTSFYSNDSNKFWMDKQLIPEEKCREKEKLPFVIRIKKPTKAEIHVNPYFRFNKKKSHCSYEMTQFMTHCVVNGTFEPNYLIKTLAAGVVVRDGDEGWRMSQKPQITSITDINLKNFEIVKKAVLRVLWTVINPGDMDMSLLKLGATYPFKVNLIYEIGKMANKNLPVYAADEMKTVKDLYNLL